jgi:hypothetical protein
VSAVPQVTKTGPRTYTPAEAIIGGQLVEARAGSRIGVAAADSPRVLGVALTDAINPEANTGVPTVVNGREVLNAALLPTVVAVAYGGGEAPVTYAVAAGFGDRLVAAANGQVRPFNLTDPDGAGAAVADNPALIVGTCTALAGVAAGAVGLMRIA